MIENPTHATTRDMSAFVGCIRASFDYMANWSDSKEKKMSEKMTKGQSRSSGKRQAVAKVKSPANQGGGTEAPSGRFWTQWIPPRGAALLAERLGPICFVVKNYGTNNVFLAAEGGDLFDLSPGAVRATHAHGIVRVENRTEEPALIEFDFLPILK